MMLASKLSDVFKMEFQILNDLKMNCTLWSSVDNLIATKQCYWNGWRWFCRISKLDSRSDANDSVIFFVNLCNMWWSKYDSFGSYVTFGNIRLPYCEIWGRPGDFVSVLYWRECFYKFWARSLWDLEGPHFTLLHQFPLVSKSRKWMMTWYINLHLFGG